MVSATERVHLDAVLPGAYLTWDRAFQSALFGKREAGEQKRDGHQCVPGLLERRTDRMGGVAMAMTKVSPVTAAVNAATQ